MPDKIYIGFFRYKGYLTEDKVLSNTSLSNTFSQGYLQKTDLLRTETETIYTTSFIWKNF